MKTWRHQCRECLAAHMQQDIEIAELRAQVAEYRGRADAAEKQLRREYEACRWRDMDAEPPDDEDDDMILVWGCCEKSGDPWQEIVLNTLAPFERGDWTFTHWRPLQNRMPFKQATVAKGGT